MAIGDIVNGDLNTSVELLASATATNSPPSGASAGLAVSALKVYTDIPDKVRLLVNSDAGSGTMTVTCKLWGYHPGPAAWMPIGTGAGASKGIVNGGSAIDEGSEADTIAHAELIELPKHFTRLYLEVTAIGGTGTSVVGRLVVEK